VIALTHVPSPAMQACERTFVPHVPIDPVRIAEEHAAYCRLLAECGVAVRTLDVNRGLPDAVFIEDTAVVLDEIAILCPMGAASRRLEPLAIEPVLRDYRDLLRIELPAMLEGGDVLRVGRTLLVGHSRRTNRAGIDALDSIARRYGYRVISVPVSGSLHLKTACCALPDGRLLINPAWIDPSALGAFDLVTVPEAEPWAANIAIVRREVLLNAAHVQTAELVQSLGFAVRATDLREFAKAEGGITCLSLRIS
jgi:dimethylargininase